MESAAAVVVSAAAAVVSAVELDPHPVNAEAATTAAIASAVTFFIISISPQIFLFCNIPLSFSGSVYPPLQTGSHILKCVVALRFNACK